MKTTIEVKNGKIKVTTDNNDRVTINSGYRKSVMTRDNAIENYLECMCMCEGSEQERCTNVFLDLISGASCVKDF